MNFKEFLIESEYQSANNYEDFVKKNMNLIKKEVEEEKEKLSLIKDEKQRDKLYKEFLRQQKIKITEIYTKLRKK